MSRNDVHSVAQASITVELDSLPSMARAWLLDAWQSGAAGYSRSGSVLVLAHTAAWGLPDDVLEHGLGLRRFRGAVRMRQHGLVGRTGHSWQLQWPAATEPDGCVVHGPTGRMLMAPELAAADRLCERTSGASKASVFRALIELQQLADRCADLRIPERLRNSKVQEAGKVRIEVEEGPDGPMPWPRLLSGSLAPRRHPAPDPEDAGSAQQNAWDPGGSPAPEPEAIAVDPVELVRDVLGQSTEDSVVRLGDGEYVVLSKEVFLNLVLTLYGREQDAGTRRRFTENPTAFLPAPEAFDEAHYSARVVGIGEAPKPSMTEPVEARSWVTPADGLLLELEDGVVLVPQDRLAVLSERLADAIARGDPALEWDGVEVPASPDVLEAVQRAGTSTDGSRGDNDASEGPLTRVLRIQENASVLDWVPVKGAGRRAPRPGSPPLADGVELQAHQRQALCRLSRLWLQGESGALLCDDMGLGKTMQALAFASWVHRQLSAGGGRPDGPAVDLPVMVVGPPSLLEGWLAELNRRLPAAAFLRVLWGAGALPGNTCGRDVRLLRNFRADRKASGGSVAVLEHARLDKAMLRAFAADILFIGYDSLRSLQFAVGELRVGLVIADEAQMVKNPTSLRSHALRAMNHDFALALTGTPIENTWTDLWTLCDFATPGMLGPLAEFRERFPASGEVRDVGARLARKVRDVLIRRTRSGALHGLPPCRVTSETRTMPLAQARAYRAEVARFGGGQQGVLGLIQALARVSLHPRLRAVFAHQADALSWLRASARTVVLEEALRRWEATGEAVIVFVRALAMQETLARALELAFGLPRVEVLNGRISMGERQRMVGRFRDASGFRVMLVSPDVGGAGWNMQFAARSVLLERPFNPAVEAQMIARTWRLGQHRPVEVVAPVAVLEGLQTFDELLDGMLEEKRTLAESVLAPVVTETKELARRFSILAQSALEP